MSLDSLLHFISTAHSPETAETDLAFAEITSKGKISSINPFGRLTWGWRTGTELPEDLLFALECIEGEGPIELPLTVGGLHLRGMMVGDGEGWFLIGYEPDNETSAGDQFTFRALMDKIPQPALCINTSGLAWYVNRAVAQELGESSESLLGRPALAELINPEDRWKLADLLELAAKDGSSHASVRYGNSDSIGVLHLVHSVRDEFQAVILPIFDRNILVQDSCIQDAYVQESFYQTFLEQGPVGVLYLDSAGSVTFENHTFRSMVGEVPDSSWLGLNVTNVAALPSEAATILMEICTAGGSRTFTSDLLNPFEDSQNDDHAGVISRHVQIHASAIQHPDGHIIGAALLFEDRTEFLRQQTDRDRTKKGERLQNELRELATADIEPDAFRKHAMALLGGSIGADTAHFMGLSVAKDRLVEFASWTSQATAAPTQSIGRSDLNQIENAQKGTYISSRDDFYAPICHRFDAESCWVAPVKDNGQFAGFLFFGWNHEESPQLWASEVRLDEFVRLFETLYSGIQLGARYRRAVATIDDALFEFSFFRDGRRRYHFATDQYELLTGYRPSDLLAENEERIDWVADVVHQEDASLVRAHNSTLLDGHESRVTYRIRHADGSTRWLREHATPLADATGMTAVNGIISDVSEQKAAEIVLLQAKKEAEESDRSKTSFIATLSHEIRTPLGAVNGFAQLLEKELEEFEEELPMDLPEQVSEFVAAISDRSQKLLALVHDLFELSNIEMGKASLSRSLFDLESVLRASVEKSRSGIERKGLELSLSVHDSDLKVQGDARRLSQVFDNLLSNASKFTDSGHIRVELHRTQADIRIEISDTGIGIASEYQNKLFEAFSQEENWRTRRYEGTGLGLAFVRKLLDLMGGSIEVESKQGEGSTFRVLLPLLTPDSASLTDPNAVDPHSLTRI